MPFKKDHLPDISQDSETINQCPNIEKHGQDSISDWKDFYEAFRGKGIPLLSRHRDYKESIYVTGCPRSGTSITTRIIGKSKSIVSDPMEFSVALMLSGVQETPSATGRHCFHTTYIHNQYIEFLDLEPGDKIVWVIRNPESVIWSILYNWPSYVLDDLFSCCNQGYLHEHQVSRASKLEKACYSYLGKGEMLNNLVSSVLESRLYVLDYEDLVGKPELILPHLFDFLGIFYTEEYAQAIHRDSLNNKMGLNMEEQEMIFRLCQPVYEQMKAYVSH